MKNLSNVTYDMIFIDAAKAQNTNFFKSFSRNLNDNGFIITDNLDFHGFVNQPESEIKSKNVRAIVRKIKEYIDFLEQNEAFETNFYKVGDGVSVSRKK